MYDMTVFIHSYTDLLHSQGGVPMLLDIMHVLRLGFFWVGQCNGIQSWHATVYCSLVIVIHYMNGVEIMLAS